MAYVNKNGNLSNVRGRVGNQLVVRRWGGKTFVSQAPGERTKKRGRIQKEQNDNFTVASKYAKSVSDHRDSFLAQGYAAVLQKKETLYLRAIRDFLTVPMILSIDTDRYKGNPGDSINVRAIDDFQVDTVRVDIYTPDGVLLESGLAPYNEALTYKYTATLANNQLSGTRIKVIATDLPGGEGIGEVML